MAYSDQKFYSRLLVPLCLASNAGTSTATASGHAPTTTAAVRLKKYLRRTKVSAVRVAVDTAPGAALTTAKLIFLNGTDTFAVATIGTNTAGVSVDASMTVANATIAADVQPTVNFTGTSTASANTANGVFTIQFEEQEQNS